MKKEQFRILLCFLIFIGAFAMKADSASAIMVTQDFVATNKAKMARVETVSYQKSVTWKGKTYYFAHFEVGGTMALCIDPFTYLSNTAKKGAYIMQDTRLKNNVYYQALTYLTLKNTEDIYVVAQAYVWTGGNVTDTMSLAFRYYGMIGENQTYTDYKGGSSSGLSAEAVSKIVNGIKGMPTGEGVYVWESACGTSQRFVTLIPARKACDETCVCDPSGEPSEPSVCPATPEQTGSGTCTNTSLEDPEWSCIVGNSNYLDTTHNDPENKNPYCSFYCRETLNSSFPINEQTFEAGQYFTVGYGLRNVWGPVEFYGTRECRSYYNNGSKWVEGINTQQFINDYNTSVENIPKYYTEWQNELRKQAAANSASSHDNDAHCPNTDRIFEDPIYDDKSGLWTCPSGYRWGEYGCYKDVVTSYGTYYYSNSYTKYYIDGRLPTTEHTSAGCSRDSADPDSAYNSYIQALNEAKTYLNYIRQCEAMNTPYQLNPVVNFSYNIGSTYDWSGELKSSYESNASAPATNGAATSNKNNSVYGNSSGCSGTNCSVVAYSCSGAYCNARTSLRENIYNVNVSTKRTITFKTASYSLPDNLYKYTDKINGKAYKTLPSNIKDSVSYIDLSESTLPIDTYISPGKYDLSLSYSKLGNIVNGSAHFDSLVQNLDNDYKCPIQIDNTLIVPECKENPTSSSCSNPSGIDVIYRTIKLGSQDVAFPSIDGDGRTPGANWNSEDGSIVSKYITNNRNVQGEEVYTLTPLYKITLTPTIIKQIRTYNKAVNDYGDFNLSCEIDSSGKATGRKCISNFIHNTVSANGASYNFSAYFDSNATCQNITTGTFYSCADK